MAELAKDCVYYRAKHNLTQEEMGRKCGVDRGVIIDVEKERPVSKRTEAKIRLVIDEN